MAFAAEVWAAPPADPAYRHLFASFVDSRSLSEKVLNTAGLTTRDVGRSFAVVAGVSSYPNLPDPVLEPAAQDIARLVDYLKRVEGFDEIVVLQNGDMNDANLKYFLQSYFPDRLKLFPKSRFLFAYSGHGFNDGARGYLLQSSARNISDRANSINLNTLKVFVDEVVDNGYQVLVLINSCYSGAFLSRKAFGDRTLLPRNPGAHAITAGATGELSWHDARFGPGSIFFEKLLAGLDGRADKYPDNGDGIVGIEELYAYLRSEIQLATNQKQNPQIGDITRDGALGGFFFLDRRRQVNRGTLAEWRPSNTAVSFSAAELSEPNSHPAPQTRNQSTDDNTKSSPRTTPGEQQLWLATEKAGTVEAVDYFLKQYPSGQYAVVANSTRVALVQKQQADANRAFVGRWEGVVNCPLRDTSVVSEQRGRIALEIDLQGNAQPRVMASAYKTLDFASLQKYSGYYPKEKMIYSRCQLDVSTVSLNRLSVGWSTSSSSNCPVQDKDRYVGTTFINIQLSSDGSALLATQNGGWVPCPLAPSGLEFRLLKQ